MVSPAVKRKVKQASPIPVPYHQVDQRRTEWLALLPAALRQNIEQGGHALNGEEQQLAWHVAGCARCVWEWWQFDPLTWACPPTFEAHRLAKATAWLKALDPRQYPYVREDALRILLDTWPAWLAACQDSDLIFDTIPSLWLPNDEFAPLTSQLPCLPEWHLTHEMPERAEVARVAEQFYVYSGLVTWLNVQLGTIATAGMLDLEPDPF